MGKQSQARLVQCRMRSRALSILAYLLCHAVQVPTLDHGMEILDSVHTRPQREEEEAPYESESFLQSARETIVASLERVCGGKEGEQVEVVSISPVASGCCQEEVLVAMEAGLQSALTQWSHGLHCASLLGFQSAKKGDS